MTTNHYKELAEGAKAARKAGLYGKAVRLTLEKNKSPLMVLGAAGVGWWVLQSETLNKWSVFRDNWWLKGALMLIVGWVLWRKQNPYAQIVLALGAVQLIDSYKARPKEKETAGPEDTGWDTSEDTGWEGRYRWGHETAGGNDPVLTGSGRTVEMADRIFRGAVAA
jgi:hypothetical protein